ETVFHYLYGFYNLGYSRSDLVHVYIKSERAISNWISVYEATGTFQRANSTCDNKFFADHRHWLLKYYQGKPLAYLDEAQREFHRVHRIKHCLVEELSAVQWNHWNLVFLDEVSFDNRGMIRKEVTLSGARRSLFVETFDANRESQYWHSLVSMGYWVITTRKRETSGIIQAPSQCGS
ncbi:TPA: hypothetical protein N0F65_012746, partial [Lagenidium giganteum]